MQHSIGDCFFSSSSGDGAAHADGLYLLPWVCDLSLSRHADRLARAASSHFLLAGVQASRAPGADDPSWQARAGTGFAKAQFLVDWDRQIVTYPIGKQSISWLPNTYPQNGITWDERFARKDCTPCPQRAQCTQAKKEPRIVGLQAQEQYEALHAARQRQTTDAFAQHCAPRAGIEGMHAQGIHRCGLQQARYIGLARTHLQHIATAAALNVVRIGEWLAGTPQAKTWCSPFAALKAA